MIDRQLASLKDEQLLPAEPKGAPAGTPRPGAAPAAVPTRAPAPAGTVPRHGAVGTAGTVVIPADVPPRTWRGRLAVGGKLLLATAAAVAATPVVWPYGWRCGIELGVYLGLVAFVVLSGLWAARASWRHRAGFSHVLSLLLVLWGLGLGAWQVLPRARLISLNMAVVPSERVAVPAVWACQ